MSRPPIMIADLKPELNVWKIVVRVVDLWIVKERNGQQHLEAIIQDANAEKIHVLTRSRELEVWTNTLQDNQTYMVYNGETLLNDLPTKVCDNKYKLFFNRATTVTAIDIPDIPQTCFHFKSFAEILNGDFVVDRLYDIIGVVQQVVRTQVAGANKKAFVNLTLADECGSELDVTLWESYANQFMNYTSENGQLVLILTHAWCRQSSSTGKLNMSNAWHGSKLLLNHEHPQVDQFKTKFLQGNFDHPASQALSLNTSSQGSVDDRAFSFIGDVKSIGEMITQPQESFCNTVGETKRFRANPFGWYYEVCPTCNKTNQNLGGPFQCNCAANGSAPITKYKIEVEVEWESRSANFVFWDKECIPYVGMSAHALRQLMKKTNEDHPNIYPDHLDHLLDKKFAFRAKYQSYYRQASVVRLTQDPDVIKQIEDAIAVAQAAIAIDIPTTVESIKGKEKLCLEDEIASSQIPTNIEGAKGKAVLCLEDDNGNFTPTQTTKETTTTSAAQNWSPERSNNNTPSKRLSPSVSTQYPEAPDFNSPKLSATKSARTKGGRHNKSNNN